MIIAGFDVLQTLTELTIVALAELNEPKTAKSYINNMFYTMKEGLGSHSTKSLQIQKQEGFGFEQEIQ